METEEKKVGTAWEEKIRQINGEELYGYLFQIDEAFIACEIALEEVGMGTGYVTKLQEIENVMDQLEVLWKYVYALREYAEEKVDKPLHKAFANGATEGISRIRMEDFEVDVTGTDININETVNQINVDYTYTSTNRKTKLTFEDFMGTQSGKRTHYGNTSTITLNSVEGFLSVFHQQYEQMKESIKNRDGKQMTEVEYLEQLQSMGEFSHEMDKAVESFLSGLLDITIIKPLFESCTGKDLITREDLSDTERALKAVFAVLDAITLGQAMAATGVTKVATKEGLKQMGKVAVIELGTNAAGYTVSAMGEQLELPIWATLLLSVGGGTAVNRLMSKKMLAGQAVKVYEGGKYSAFGEMSFKDGKKYSAWNKLREGLTFEQAEKIKYIDKGQKPAPETYLSDEYIQNHLQSFKDSGAVKIMPNKPSGTIGGKGGTFVMSGDELDEIIQYANGDISKIEDALGLDPGYLEKNPVIVMMDDSSNVRMPSGNELGAWPEYWESGGYTSGGIKEAVIDPVPEGEYTYKFLFE